MLLVQLTLTLLALVLSATPASIRTRHGAGHVYAYPIAIRLTLSDPQVAEGVAKECALIVVESSFIDEQHFLLFDPVKKSQNELPTFRCLESRQEVEWFAEQGPINPVRPFYRAYPEGQFKRPVKTTSRIGALTNSVVYWLGEIKKLIVSLAAILFKIVSSLYGFNKMLM